MMWWFGVVLSSEAMVLPPSRPAKISAASRRELLSLALGSAPWLAAADDSAVGLASTAERLPRFEAEAAAAADAALGVAEAYKRDGVAVVRDVVSAFWIDALRAGCEEAQDASGPFAQYMGAPRDAGTFFTDLEMARRLPTFAHFALSGPCAAVAGVATQSSSVRYLYDQLFIKEGVSVPTPWHQDGGYWRVKGDDLCSVFVALDDVDRSDCLQFIPGTHRWPLHNPAHFADGTPYRGTNLPELTQRDLDKVPDRLAFDLAPGDVIVFSSRTVHGGAGNWGRALSTRWAGDDVRFWPRPGEGAVPTGDLGLRDGDGLTRNPTAFPEAWRAAA